MVRDDELSAFDEAARAVVELGNRLADQDPEADLWDIASGVLAGAVQYWLYSRQPCGDPSCDSCEAINTAARRMAEMQRELAQFAEESEYYHSPQDTDVGRA